MSVFARRFRLNRQRRITSGVPPPGSQQRNIHPVQFSPMVAHAFGIGDLVRDRTLGLIWSVVDQDDDGTTYIERNNVRSFAAIWDLEVVALPKDSNTNPPAQI